MIFLKHLNRFLPRIRKKSRNTERRIKQNNYLAKCKYIKNLKKCITWSSTGHFFALMLLCKTHMCVTSTKSFRVIIDNI